MGGFDKFFKKSLPEVALTFLGVTVANLLTKPTVRSAIRGQVRRIVTGSREKLPYQEVPDVEYYADKIMKIIDDKRITPKRICIDGMPGSGKSSLGRGLAKRTCLKWRTLYLKELNEDYPFKDGRIYESVRILRTQNIEGFDVIVYLGGDIMEAKERVLKRDRNGMLIDLLDFSKIKRIGDTAFEILGGEEITVEESTIRIKIRPQEGYRDVENLRNQLQAKGFDSEGYSKEELLFLYCYGKRQSGLFPYIKFGAYNEEIMSGLYTALRRPLSKILS